MTREQALGVAAVLVKYLQAIGVVAVPVVGLQDNAYALHATDKPRQITLTLIDASDVEKLVAALSKAIQS